MIEPVPLEPQASVGIDVVDLTSPRALRGLPKPRTVERVLTDEEKARLADSADPTTLFWSYWAAKEAAFKSATLLRAAPPVFAHAAFEVDLDAARVSYGDRTFRLTINLSGPRLVAVVHPAIAEEGADAAPGASGARRASAAGIHRAGAAKPLVWAAGKIDALHRGVEGASLEVLRASAFSGREVDAVRGLPSALVRLAVRREAAAFLELDEKRLQVICPPGPAGRRPPYLFIDGDLAAHVGVSISHDEDWLAWAVAGRRHS